MKSNKNIKIVGIILVLIVVVGILFWQNWQSPQQIGEEEAISLIKNRPEVKEWLALFAGPDGTSPTTKGKPIIVVDKKSDKEYTIHAYEQMPDHRATFNWYTVNLETGEIKPMFLTNYTK